MNFHWNAAAVIFDSNTIVRVYCDRNVVTITCESLIDRVVYNFVDEVMKGFDVGAANIHARSATDSLKSFEDLDITCIVVFGFIVQFFAPKVYARFVSDI